MSTPATSHAAPDLNGSVADVRVLEDAVNADTTMKGTAARFFAALELTPRQRAEIVRLLDKNNAGTITDKEKAVLESYTRVGNFLNLLRAKARASLPRRGSRR